MIKVLILHNYLNELALALAIILTGLAQVLLRIGARKRTKAIDSFFNIKTFSGYVIFLVVILLMIYSMQKIPFRTAVAWSSVTYILTPLLAHWIAKDTLSNRILTGSIVVVFGIIIFSL